ncbi:MAG: hypothetical protein HOW97_02995 [Catenulispora sp.]|nr:hypothetical protein [Catenulispora sp.]
MAAFEQREVTSTRREYVLRAPAPAAELHTMLAAAEADHRQQLGLPPGAKLADDALTVSVSDNEVIVSFDYPGPARTGGTP